MRIRTSAFLLVCVSLTSVHTIQAAPTTLPADECVTEAELKAYVRPNAHMGQDWCDQVRSIACTFEVTAGEPDYGRVIVVGSCDTEGNCDANCGTSNPPTVKATTLKVGKTVKINQKDNWKTDINVKGGLSWGNEKSASSLIFGAAKASVEAGWAKGWGGEEGVEVTVGQEKTITVDPCKWIRAYSYGSYRSGAHRNAKISVTVKYDPHCSICKKWIGLQTRQLASGMSNVRVTYAIGKNVGDNLASGDCNGLTKTGLGTATKCPGSMENVLKQFDLSD